MPNVADICGIVFCMFNEMGNSHHRKHVFVKYGDYKANYDIETGRRINGKMGYFHNFVKRERGSICVNNL